MTFLTPSTFTRERSFTCPLPVRSLLAFVATLALSTLSYFLLERPFLRLKTRFEG